MGQIYNSLTWQEMNKAQAVPLNGVKVPLDGELFHQSKFYDSLITEQGCMEGLPKVFCFCFKLYRADQFWLCRPNQEKLLMQR